MQITSTSSSRWEYALYFENWSEQQAILTPQGRLALNQLLSECVADCELAAAIEASSKLHRISNKRHLFRQGQPADRLFLLHAGEIVLTSRLPDHKVLGFRVAPGSLIGLRAIAGGQPHSMTATVRKYSEMYSISLWTFRELVGKNPRLSFRVQEILAAEARSARLQVSNALSMVRGGRVADIETPVPLLEDAAGQ
jgi:CRP-like cAMP-binding protein